MSIFESVLLEAFRMMESREGDLDKATARVGGKRLQRGGDCASSCSHVCRISNYIRMEG